MARVVVKLGSAVVATEDGELRAEILERTCDALAAAHDAGEEVVIVTSGAIARGTRALGRSGRPNAIDELQAASAVGQGGLYRAYDEILARRGVLAAQVLLTFSDVSDRASYLNARQTLGKLLEWRVIPVVNENDTTATDEITFGDNDFLAAQVAILVGAARLIILTNSDGLHTADPSRDPGAALVERVDDPAQLDELEITQSTSAHGSGGMRSKVVAADMATAAGIETVICSGVREGVLERVLDGEREGTLFVARPGRYSSFKLWLRYAKPSRGIIAVDPGAARALRDGGTSLLPVGIVEVRGEFAEGDAVDVIHGPALIGKGICNFSSAELRLAAGRPTAAVRELLPQASVEAVHRDYFVLA
jgi:glutamate 5-kinase